MSAAMSALLSHVEVPNACLAAAALAMGNAMPTGAFVDGAPPGVPVS